MNTIPQYNRLKNTDFKILYYGPNRHGQREIYFTLSSPNFPFIHVPQKSFAYTVQIKVYYIGELKLKGKLKLRVIRSVRL